MPPTVPAQPCVSDKVAAARPLVETTTLPLRVIAAQVGMPRSTLSKLKTRHGWLRPKPARVSLASQHGGGHAIVPEIVAECRRLMEETRLSFVAISERTGVSPATLCRWRKRHQWPRPPSPIRPGRDRPARYRRRGRPYAADALGDAKHLVTASLMSQKAIARSVGVCQAQISVWMRERGWQRPAVRPGSTRFAAATRTGPLEAEGDRRGRPYAKQTRREARALWELTRLPSSLIGARLGVHPVTVARWAREETWDRPHGRIGRAQLRGWFGMMKRGG